MKNNTLQKSIMRRVYAVWFLKKITQPLFVKVYIFALLMWQFMSQVSMANVINNVPADFGKSINFFLDALIKTEVMVQGILLLSVVLGVFMVRDVLKREPHLEIV